MTLPVGTISLADVNTELGYSSTALISLNDANVRALAAVPSGQISMSDLQGKSNNFFGTISTNQTNLNLRTWALANGWNGSSPATVTINAGVYVYSTILGGAGITISGSWPGGITLINNGYIHGRGGNGGLYTGNGAAVGTAGSNAISLGVNATITNNSGAYIAGGGGGGVTYYSGGGGGAGGGNGGTVYTSVGYTGGNGGFTGNAGDNGVNITYGGFSWGTGGGGGSILPGTGGAAGSRLSTTNMQGRGGGSGGGGGASYSYVYDGGAGGSSNVFGADVTTGGGGGGGGWAATGGNVSGSGIWIGGSGGKAIALNGYTATTSGSGTYYGAIS
jgi:hypothetical protein